MDNCAECVTHTEIYIYNIYSNDCKILANHKAIASNDSSNCAKQIDNSRQRENFFRKGRKGLLLYLLGLAINFSITFIPAVATFALL